MSTTDIVNAVATVGEDHDEEDEEEDEFAGYSKNLIARLLALRQIQKEHELVDEQYRTERLVLEQKYFNERKPLLERRHGIVSGVVEVAIPADVQAATGTDVAVPEPGAGAEEEEEKGVEGFWLQCIQNHPTLGNMIHEHDFPILEALNNVTCEYNEDWSGFTLSFHFDDNEFFTNSILTKKYLVDPDLLDDKAPALSEIDGCVIDWKPKKNVCIKETQKKQKAKKGRNQGQTRVITISAPQHSFFNFFAEPTDADEKDEDEEGEGAEAEADPVLFSIDEDYEAAHAFRAELIPAAIYWYTGEACGMDDDEEDDEDFEGDDDDDDEELDDDEPEEESHDDKDKGHGKGGGKKGKKFTAPPGAAGEQPECKQS